MLRVQGPSHRDVIVEEKIDTGNIPTAVTVYTGSSPFQLYCHTVHQQFSEQYGEKRILSKIELHFNHGAVF